MNRYPVGHKPRQGADYESNPSCLPLRLMSGSCQRAKAARPEHEVRVRLDRADALETSSRRRVAAVDLCPASFVPSSTLHVLLHLRE
jgi:hypothetical protein